jgi:Cyclic nucleotide-binding domain
MGASTTAETPDGALGTRTQASYRADMRHTSSVTSLSWIPSEAVTGLNKAIFASGFTHYDPPPPDVIDDLDALRDEDRFRFANHLSAWIDVEDGEVRDAGYTGGIVMGATTIAIGSRGSTFAAVAFPDIQQPPEITGGSARFVQTVGGHTAVPAPRRVSHPPFVQFEAPTVWSTLALTLHADGRADFELIGASQFPRHWVYGPDGALSAKAGLADFKDWWRHAFGAHTPWGDQETPALVTAVETALERELAAHIMRGDQKPRFKTLKPGKLLTEQGAEDDDVFLLLNGVLTVEVDGEPIAEVGPGAILGERAALEGGRRTSTLRALTKAKVAVVGADQLEAGALQDVGAGHRREDEQSGTGAGTR